MKRQITCSVSHHHHLLLSTEKHVVRKSGLKSGDYKQKWTHGITSMGYNNRVDIVLMNQAPSIETLKEVYKELT